MARYIKAVECAEIISEKLNIPLGDLVDIFAEIPTADVVPKSEVIAIFNEFESTLDLIGAMVGLDIRLNGSYTELKKKYTEGEQRND